jgi:hypothetical protein
MADEKMGINKNQLLRDSAFALGGGVLGYGVWHFTHVGKEEKSSVEKKETLSKKTSMES